MRFNILPLFLGLVVASPTPAINDYQQPGLAMRLNQQTINEFKKAMEEFLPHFVDADLKFPTEYEQTFELLFGLITFDIKWEDVTYNTPRLDVADIDIELNTFPQFNNASAFKMYFPAIEYWEMTAHQIQKHWLVEHESDISLIFQDLSFEFDFGFVVDENHYLDPIVYNCLIDFGDSFLYFNNRWIAFAMHQIVEMFILVVENTCRFSHVGMYVYSDLLGPGMDKWLNNYQLEFKD